MLSSTSNYQCKRSPSNSVLDPNEWAQMNGPTGPEPWAQMNPLEWSRARA